MFLSLSVRVSIRASGGQTVRCETEESFLWTATDCFCMQPCRSPASDKEFLRRAMGQLTVFRRSSTVRVPVSLSSSEL